MKTTLKAISLIIGFSMLNSAVVSAQSVLPISTSNWSGVCVNLPNTLSYGATSSSVTRLQVFLVAQNFPGSGSWMETGHFGAATEAAVKDFQQEINLPISGIADGATRAAISRITCGSALLSPAPVTSYPTPAPISIPWNQYSNNYGNSYGNGNGLISLNLIALSQNTGSVGTQVTIYGTGFDTTGNTINFGSVALTGIRSAVTLISRSRIPAARATLLSLPSINTANMAVVAITPTRIIILVIIWVIHLLVHAAVRTM
jgi:peptidoglycan hydrolase-like protein with peptidoglycan-binding domain